MKRFLITSMSFLFFASMAAALELSEIHTYDSGSYPRGVEIADVDNDGKNEIIVTNFGEDTLIGRENETEPSSSITVFGSAKGAELTKKVLAAGKSPRGLATGDIDGDRKDDFVVSNYEDGTITIFGQEEGGVFEKETLEAGKHPVGVALGDIDSSGNVKADIAVSVYSENKVVVFIRDSHGEWEKNDISVPGSPTDVVTGVINGKRLLVSANYSAGSVSVIKKEKGEIKKTQDIKAGGGPCKVEIGDVTGDNVNDIVVANFYDNTVSVIEYKNGEAAEAVNYKLEGSRPNGMCLGDVNGDGRLDVVTANRDSDTIDILIQQESGKLLLENSIQVTNDEDKTYGPVEVKCGDINGDGLDDIVFSHMRSGTLRVIYSESNSVQAARKVPAEPISRENTYNYPNPAKDSTTIRFSLDEPTDVEIVIYDAAGRTLWEKALSETETRAGVNRVVWDLVTNTGNDAANGVYIYKVITGSRSITKKIVVLK